MGMTATARLITGTVGDTGSQYLPTFDDDRQNGMSASRSYLTNSRDLVESRMAAGVPAKGDPWDVSTPNLIAQTISVRPFEGNQCIVTVRYAEDRGAGITVTPPTALGTVRTETNAQIITIDSRVDADDNLIPNGQSYDRETPSLEFVVQLYVSPERATQILTLWKNLAGHLNDGELSLPKLYGSNHSWTAPSKTLLLRAPDTNLVDANDEEPVVEIALPFGYAEDWDVQVHITDAKDIVVAQALRPGYKSKPAAEFAALWAEGGGTTS